MATLVAFGAGGSAGDAAEVLRVSSFAGSRGGGGYVDAAGANARFNLPQDIAIDGAGNVYVADTNNCVIRKITPGGAVTLVAGQVGVASSLDGPVGVATFQAPRAVALDNEGNLLVADQGSIRRISTQGVVTTVANVVVWGLVVDSDGNIYGAEKWDNRICRITPAGVVTTFAGNATAGAVDGKGTSARFDHPEGIDIDADGNLYVADTGNNTVRKITPAGDVSTLAGVPGAYGNVDGSGTDARLNGPRGLAVDKAGNIYVSENSHSIRRITSAGVVTTLAGNLLSGSVDGNGTQAQFYQPLGVDCDATGNVFIADSFNSVVRRVTPTGTVSTFAGSPPAEGAVDGLGSVARFSSPRNVATDSAGNIYVADTLNFVVRKITPDGLVSTLAGMAGAQDSVDGHGPNARFEYPSGVFVGPDGSVYVSDYSTVRKITSAGLVSTIAGTPKNPGYRDGDAADAQFSEPVGIVMDSHGNLFVADQAHTIRKITPDGIVSTFAGRGFEMGYVDGTAGGARLAQPQGLAIDAHDNLYVADYGNHSIRKITPGGEVTTYAGNGTWGSTDGTGPAARFAYPAGLAFDGSGNLLVVETYASLRSIAPGAVVKTVAGRGGYRGNVDGVGLDARLNEPSGVAVASNGAIYIADAGNHAIRRGRMITQPEISWSNPAEIRYGTALSSQQLNASADTAGSFVYTPAAGSVLPAGTHVLKTTFTPADQERFTTATAEVYLTVLGIAPSFTSSHSQKVSRDVGQSVTFTVTLEGHPSPSLQWFKDYVLIPGATGASLTISDVSVADAGSYMVTAVNAWGSAASHVVTLAVNSAPVVELQPEAQSVQEGGGAVFAVVASGASPLSYQWQIKRAGEVNWANVANAGAYSGAATADNFRVSPVSLAMSGDQFRCVVTNTLGTATSQPATLTVEAMASAPVFTAHPANRVVSPLGVATFEVSVSGTPTPQVRWQWSGDGGANWADLANAGAFSGVATSKLTVVATSEVPTGALLRALATNTAGAATSNSATITVRKEENNNPPAGNSSTRLVALAARAAAGSGDQTLIMGFVVNGNKEVLVQGVGPGIAASVPTALTDPRLELYRFQSGSFTKVDENNDWVNTSAITEARARLGASALAAGSKDAALLKSISGGVYTAHVASGGSAGVALVEAYDADVGGSSRLMALSTRTVAGAGDATLIAGFVLEGNGPKTVLIRGLGPELALRGVQGVLADPKITVYRGSNVVGSNDDWGGTSELKEAFDAVGADRLASDTSKDAAMLVTLNPGAYTVHVTGAAGTTGVALVEIFDVP